MTPAVKQYNIAYSAYSDEPPLWTTSLSLYSNLSQKAVAKEDYSVHSDIFVIAHTALGAVGEEAVLAQVSSATVAPGHKGHIVRVTVLHTVTAGGGHINTVQCGKRMK